MGAVPTAPAKPRCCCCCCCSCCCYCCCCWRLCGCTGDFGLISCQCVSCLQNKWVRMVKLFRKLGFLPLTFNILHGSSVGQVKAQHPAPPAPPHMSTAVPRQGLPLADTVLSQCVPAALPLPPGHSSAYDEAR